MSHLVVVPAYGRDYKSKKAVLADWDEDLDFRAMPRGQYINKEGAIEHGISSIEFRYGKLAKVFVLEL